jgi:hypothetical protein
VSRGVLRDITDQHLRRGAKALGYKGRSLPMTLAEVIVHPNRPNDYTLLHYDGERRRDALNRLRSWSQPQVNSTVNPESPDSPTDPEGAE